jgi:hypothetical protein
MTQSSNGKRLNRMPVMLSASIPDDLAQTPRSQDLMTAIALLTREIAAADGRIVFGGHPSITPLIHQALTRLGKKGMADLFQLSYFKNSAPKHIWDTDIFQKINWIGHEKDTLSDALFEQMREEMAKASKAAVFIGGKTSGSLSKTPGIRDEYQRFLKHHPEGPVYLTGFMDGETLNIIRELEKQKQKEKNGLSDNELQIVRHSRSIDLIVSLIVEDLAKTAAALP